MENVSSSKPRSKVISEEYWREMKWNGNLSQHQRYLSQESPWLSEDIPVAWLRSLLGRWQRVLVSQFPSVISWLLSFWAACSSSRLSGKCDALILTRSNVFFTLRKCFSL